MTRGPLRTSSCSCAKSGADRRAKRKARTLAKRGRYDNLRGMGTGSPPAMKGPLTSLGARTHLWLARVPPPHWQSQRGVSGRSLADMSLEIENTSLEIENTSLEIENTYPLALGSIEGAEEQPGCPGCLVDSANLARNQSISPYQLV